MRRPFVTGTVLAAATAVLAVATISIGPGGRLALCGKVRASHRGRPSGSAGRVGFPHAHAAAAAGRIRRQGNADRRRSGRVRAQERPELRQPRGDAVESSERHGLVGRRRPRLQRFLVGLRQEGGRHQAHLADHRSARRQDAGADARGAEAGRRPARGAVSGRPSVRKIAASASAASSASIPGRRCCRAPTTTTCRSSRPATTSSLLQRDGPQRAHRPARTAGRTCRRRAPVGRRFTRPLGGRHAGGRDHELPRRDRVPELGSESAADRALQAASTPTRCSTSSPSTIRRPGRSRGPCRSR